MLFVSKDQLGGQADPQKDTGTMRGVPAAFSAALLFLCALCSAVLCTLGYSFIYYFDALNRDMRICSVLIIGTCLTFSLLLQSVAAACAAEHYFTGRGSLVPVAAVVASFGTSLGCGMLFCHAVTLFPAVLSCAFAAMGGMTARFYERKEEKMNTVLAAAIFGIGFLFLALLTQALLYEDGFLNYFSQFISRAQERFSLYSADCMDLMIATAGGEEELLELLAKRGFHVDLEKLELTAAEFLALYEENFTTALSSMLFLIPSFIFCAFSISSYISYGIFRLFCIKRGDRERRALKVSVVAAAVFFVCVMIHSFWSVFLGSGGVITVLIINLIVMLTPALLVPGVKSVKSLLKGMFSQNKLMGGLCVVIIIMSPFMVVALSGCYAVFSQAIKEHLQKKGMIP